MPTNKEAEGLWEIHNKLWREPFRALSRWEGPGETDPRLLEFSTRGDWWSTLSRLGITLLVTREYEHLVMALGASRRGPRISYLPLPHPSGLAVDRKRSRVHVASTRNPNQIYQLEPFSGLVPRGDRPRPDLAPGTLLPARSLLLPGCFYLHDLARVGPDLYATATGINTVIRFGSDGKAKPVWWPRCLDGSTRHRLSQNFLQLNSIAAGTTPAKSFYSASVESPSRRRPGHKNFSVDGRGVIFSGKTREVVGRGLTRPHSARLHRGRVWVDNSGYGELGFIRGGKFEPAVKLPGWTRGLCFVNEIAFVGTSQVLARFRHYAPGLDHRKSMTAVHAVDTRSGRVLGSLRWPYGNQIFSIDWAPAKRISGLPYGFRPRSNKNNINRLFYAATTP